MVIEEIVQALKSASVYSLDLETTSKRPLEARIVGVALSDGNKAWWIQADLPGLPFERLRPVLEDPTKTVVMHNAKYDLSCLQLAGIEVKNRVADTMIALWLLDSTKAGTSKLGLKEAVFELLGHKMTRFEETSLAGDLFGKDVEEYAKEDALMTFRLWQKLEPELKEKGLTKCFWDLEMPMVPVIMEMELTGIAVDREYLKAKDAELSEKMLALQEEAQKLVGHPVMLTSGDEVRAALFEELKLPIKVDAKRGKSGKVSVDYESLLEYKGKHRMVDLLLEYRDAQKLQSTYVRPLLKFSDMYGDWRVHTEFWQTGTDLGRWSSRGGVNLQNQPRKGGIKEAFVAPTGKKLIVADYSQLELRMAAHVSGDEEMCRIYGTGADIHAETAAACGCDRYTGKTFNFGNLYGASPARLKTILWLEGGRQVEIEQAAEWQERFWKKYKGLKAYHNRKWNQIRRGETVVRTITNRYRDVKNLKSRFEGDESAKFRVAVHFEISGSSADVMAISTRNIYRHIVEQRGKDARWKEVKPLVQVHDELVLEAPDSLAEEVAAMVKNKMETCVKLKVPLVCDCHIGTTWAAAKAK
jgi:DNA polymerase-1